MGVKRKDILWKGILEDFFKEFLKTIFPDADELFDFSKGFVFYDKELAEMHHYSLNRSPKSIDKLAGVYLKSGSLVRVRVHIEVESKAKKDFNRQMFRYFSRLYDRHDSPVISIAVFLERKNKHNVPVFKYACYGTELEFKFNAIHVAELDEQQLIQSDNPFAKVFLAAKLVLQKQIPDEEMLNKKWQIAKELLKLKLPEDQISRLMNFLKAYVHFDSKEINNKFETQLDTLTKNTCTMGITELILHLAKQEERLASIKEISRNMLLKGADIRFIHETTSLSITQIKKMQKELARS